MHWTKVTSASEGSICIANQLQGLKASMGKIKNTCTSTVVSLRTHSTYQQFSILPEADGYGNMQEISVTIVPSMTERGSHISEPPKAGFCSTLVLHAIIVVLIITVLNLIPLVFLFMNTLTIQDLSVITEVYIH